MRGRFPRQRHTQVVVVVVVVATTTTNTILLLTGEDVSLQHRTHFIRRAPYCREQPAVGHFQQGLRGVGERWAVG